MSLNPIFNPRSSCIIELGLLEYAGDRMLRLCLGLGLRLELGLGCLRLRSLIGVTATSTKLGLGCRFWVRVRVPRV